YASLTKPGITGMVGFTVAVGYWMGLAGPLDAARLLRAVVATMLASAGSAALNMYVERHRDAAMTRTRTRPLPAGRIRPVEALVLGAGLAVAGVTWLALTVAPLAALVAALCAVGYVLAYTPLKPVSSLSTWVGAPVGAAPPL